MAYEYGTLHMSSDSKSKPSAGHEDFEAVMLIVYKAKGAVCQQVALTMQPLEEKATERQAKHLASPDAQVNSALDSPLGSCDAPTGSWRRETKLWNGVHFAWAARAVRLRSGLINAPASHQTTWFVPYRSFAGQPNAVVRGIACAFSPRL
jgi:hypothetical protein